MIKNQRNYENLTKCAFPGEGKYGIPRIQPESFEECRMIGFNYAATCEKAQRAERGIHFFLDDYQFQRIWGMPDYYLPLLKQFKYVLTPDFSTYTDFPLALQIYNHYRKHWVGAYLQLHGIKVIPTISWSDEASYEWCFDGEPVESTVAVSSVGTNGNAKSRELFLQGYEKMLVRLRPAQIIFYGNVPEGCRGNILKITAFQEKFRKAVCDGWQGQL